MSIFLGSFVNLLTIAVGSVIGSVVKKGIPKRFTDALLIGNALCVIYIAIDGLNLSGALPKLNALIVILSMGLGIIVGELLNIDKNVNRFGAFVQSKFVKTNEKGESDSTFGKAFVTTTLLFCIGAMAINGSLQSAQGEHSILFAKSILDGITAMVLASTLGIGCILSALTTFIYQGLLTVVFYFVLKSVDSSSIMYLSNINHITAVGSLIILSIGLNLLGITKIKTANFIPAMIMPLLLCPLFNLLGIL